MERYRDSEGSPERGDTPGTVQAARASIAEFGALRNKIELTTTTTGLEEVRVATFLKTKWTLEYIDPQAEHDFMYYVFGNRKYLWIATYFAASCLYLVGTLLLDIKGVYLFVRLSVQLYAICNALVLYFLPSLSHDVCEWINATTCIFATAVIFLSEARLPFDGHPIYGLSNGPILFIIAILCAAGLRVKTSVPSMIATAAITFPITIWLYASSIDAVNLIVRTVYFVVGLLGGVLLAGVLEISKRKAFELDQLAALKKRDAEEQVRLCNGALLSALPEKILIQLRRDCRVEDTVKEVTVLFTDLVGFTAWSSRIESSEMCLVLNSIFLEFDAVSAQHGVEKVKTIGDSYWTICNLLEDIEDHPYQTCCAALRYLQCLADVNKNLNCNLSMRVGINTGFVLAGVFGKTRFSYDVMGIHNVIASKMESTSLPGKIQVSEFTYSHVKNNFNFRPNNKVDIPEIGEVKGYFLDTAVGETRRAVRRTEATSPDVRPSQSFLATHRPSQSFPDNQTVKSGSSAQSRRFKVKRTLLNAHLADSPAEFTADYEIETEGPSYVEHVNLTRKRIIGKFADPVTEKMYLRAAYEQSCRITAFVHGVTVLITGFLVLTYGVFKCDLLYSWIAVSLLSVSSMFGAVWYRLNGDYKPRDRAVLNVMFYLFSFCLTIAITIEGQDRLSVVSATILLLSMIGTLMPVPRVHILDRLMLPQFTVLVPSLIVIITIDRAFDFSHIKGRLAYPGCAFVCCVISQIQYDFMVRAQFESQTVKVDEMEKAVTERKLLEQILENLFPTRVIPIVLEAMKSDNPLALFQATSVVFQDSLVMFAKFTGVTNDLQLNYPKDICRILNSIYCLVDDKSMQYRSIEKVKNIGDILMVVSYEGTSTGVGDMISFAIAVKDICADFKKDYECMYSDLTCWNKFNLGAKIGISYGEVTGCFMGSTRFVWDIFGDTVNQASRMMSAGCEQTGRAIVATSEVQEAYAQQQAGDAVFAGPLRIDAKGKGVMSVYAVLS